MEGDRKITLREPGPVTHNNYGEEIPGTPVSHTVYAIRRDRGGSEGLQADTQVGNWNTRFEIRRESRISAMIQNWKNWQIEDEYEREYDIEAVSETPIGRNRWFWIYAVARS